MIANALGRDRADSVEDLARLQFSVRGDRPGRLEQDYHTGGGGEMPLLPGNLLNNPAWLRTAARLPAEAIPTIANLGDTYAAPREVAIHAGRLIAKSGNTIITTDQYLADGIFTAALTGDSSLISQISDALTLPARLLHLGRPGYPVTEPVLLATTDYSDPTEALRAWPRDARADEGPLPVWYEARPNEGGTVIPDQPGNYQNRTQTARGEAKSQVSPPANHTRTSPVDFFAAPAHGEH